MASDRTTIQQPDVEGIRAAAQWLLGAVGAVAVLVMAGFQIGEVWKLALSPDWRLWGTVAGSYFYLSGLGISSRQLFGCWCLIETTSQTC